MPPAPTHVARRQYIRSMRRPAAVAHNSSKRTALAGGSGGPQKRRMDGVQHNGIDRRLGKDRNRNGHSYGMDVFFEFQFGSPRPCKERDMYQQSRV